MRTIFMFFFLCGVCFGNPPVIPDRVTGIIIIDGSRVSRFDDEGVEVTATKKQTGEEVASDKNGLGRYDDFILDIPIDSNGHGYGVKPGDQININVYQDGKALDVVSPARGEVGIEGGQEIYTVPVQAVTPR